MDNSDASTYCSQETSFFGANIKTPRNPILFTETERSPDLASSIRWKGKQSPKLEDFRETPHELFTETERSPDLASSIRGKLVEVLTEESQQSPKLVGFTETPHGSTIREKLIKVLSPEKASFKHPQKSKTPQNLRERYQECSPEIQSHQYSYSQLPKVLTEKNTRDTSKDLKPSSRRRRPTQVFTFKTPRKPRATKNHQKLSTNKENLSQKCKAPKKKKAVSQPNPRKKPERKPRTNKFLSQPLMPKGSSSSNSSDLDYTNFEKTMKSLPTELEALQIQRKSEIEHFRKVWLNHNAGLRAINQELGIENPPEDPEFKFNCIETKEIKPDHRSMDIFEDSNDLYGFPLLSPPPPSVEPTVKAQFQNMEEIMISDEFVFGIFDLQMLASYLKVDFDKLLKAATILRNNERIEDYIDSEDEVIPASQSPRERNSFWKWRTSQTQRLSGK
ncbi:hypothetical protein ACFFRR_010616 [Megaselia abdita]